MANSYPIIAGVVGGALILVVLWEAFETIVVPRRVTRTFRLTRLFYRFTWIAWRGVARSLSNKRKEYLLGFYGPLSLLSLVALWAVALVFSFGLLHWATGSGIQGGKSLLHDLYFSGTTFFTLGLGDVAPQTAIAKALTVLESAMGFGFLALMISYFPVVYQSFSRREEDITLLDARAGSPPTAGELLRRHASDHGLEELTSMLKDWERWSAEVLESHLSYPVLCYYRSQHDNESWLAALAVVLDSCALMMVGLEGACQRQAQFTFAIARHAVVDIAQIFYTKPVTDDGNRLPPEELAELRASLRKAGIPLVDGPEAEEKLKAIRAMYEPFLISLSRFLEFPLPKWNTSGRDRDNWQTSAWGRTASLPGRPAPRKSEPDEHF